ncbi:predicted protein [Naegleria gruberi]|uniref:Predicted protein n=1 Tax=Naegleria gruberi TaxID=5762 RepID=D2VQF1_NAEGR|nr:uncharacterized protein NAEGRDRAFT_51443 [Naegleria gruberi]EFC40862.1 predicted protein [Naegleria gruberi]|eukprot:XP_002673606.1 predicted protein [Naegleria gruberi strain NEG-M]
MKFAVLPSPSSSNNSERIGEITFEEYPDKKFSTPTYIVQTRKGSVPCITCDHFDELIGNLFAGSNESVILNMNYWDLMENPSLEILTKYLEKNPTKTLKNYLHLEKYPFFQSIRNVEFPYPTSNANEKGIYADLEKGRSKFTDAEFCNHTFNMFKPDIFIGIHDTNIKCKVNDSFGTSKQLKRAKTSTEKWGETCIKKRQELVDKQQTGIPEMIYSVFYESEEMTSLIPEVFQNNTDNIKGINFDIGHMDDLEKIVKIKESLKNQKCDLEKLVFFISGKDHPLEVLECVSRGVDIFDGIYPFTIAEMGMASMYPLELPNDNPEKVKMTINLRDRNFEKDFTPLESTCTCFTCRNHTRGYIHHLLNTHEMLGDILLTM